MAGGAWSGGARLSGEEGRAGTPTALTNAMGRHGTLDGEVLVAAPSTAAPLRINLAPYGSDVAWLTGAPGLEPTPALITRKWRRSVRRSQFVAR